MLTLKQILEQRTYARDFLGKKNCTNTGTANLVVNIDPKDHICYVSTAVTAYGTVLITLPPVGQCQGGFYFFQGKNVANSKHVYVVANGQAAHGSATGDDKAMPNCDLSASLNWALLWSSGEHWYVVNSQQG